MSIPKSYKPARWRGTLPADERGRVAFCLDVAGEGTVRYVLEAEDAGQLQGSLEVSLSRYRSGTNSQSPRSSGIPSSDGSKPAEGQKV